MISGRLEVQLTDAFFADKKSIERYYVIPLRMTDVQEPTLFFSVSLL